MASYPKRARGLVTEVLCSPGEQEALRTVSAVPPEQQRLVFGPSSPLVAPYSGQDPLFAELQATQAIIFQGTRALGRLVKPRVLVDSPGELAPVSLVSLIYDYWQPASLDRKQEPAQHLRIPLDSRYCSTSLFCIRAIVTGWPGGAVALPGRHEWSGSKTAAAVSQHQQRLDYIRTQQRLFTEGEGKDSPNRHLLARSDAEYTIDTGPEWEASSLSLTFNTGTELPWLQRIILKLLVIREAPVDDKGGPIGDTSAEVTLSSSSVGVSAGPINMASASPQPVPQRHSGHQTTGGSTKQAANDRLPQTQQAEVGTSYSSPVGSCASDADAECIGAVKSVIDTRTKHGCRFSLSPTLLAYSGGAVNSCRRGASQSSRSAGGGGESQGSSDSEDEGTAHGQTGHGQGYSGPAGRGGTGLGGGSGSGGDRGDPGRERERGQEDLGAGPKTNRKQKEKEESEVADTETNGLESQQPGIVGCSHSDRDAAASLQDASSRSTTMDTADASSDAADETHAGVAESKPTVKLIPKFTGLACGQQEDGFSQPNAEQPSSDSDVSSQGQYLYVADGSASKDEGAAAVDARECANGCCGRNDSALGEAGCRDSSCTTEISLSIAGRNKLEEPVAVLSDQDFRRAECGSSFTSWRRSDDPAAPDFPPVALCAAPQLDKTGGCLAAFASGLRKAVSASTSDGSVAVIAGAVAQPCLAPPTAFNSSVVTVQPPPPPPPPPSHQQQQPYQRPYPNGATWLQAHAKSSSHGAEQQQQMPHLPQPSQLGAHAHPLQNGKLRNGEVSTDPAQWVQQLIPNLGLFIPGQSGSGSGTPPQVAQPLHPQSVGQSQSVLATLQSMLLAQHNGALQLQHQALPLPGQHMQSGIGVYGLSHHQQAQQQQAQQQLLMHQSALLQQQLLQQALQMQLQQHAQQQAVQQAQQQVHHEAQQQAQQQQQQHGTQGLLHVQLLPNEVQYIGATPSGDPVAGFTASSPTPTSTPLTVLATTLQSPATEPSAETSSSPTDGSAPQQQLQGPIPAAMQPLNPTPIVAPTPAVAQNQPSSAQGSDVAGQSGWDSGSASSVRSEPSTVLAAPLVERPIGPQHRVQSQGNMLAPAHGGAGGGQQLGQREGSGRPAYRGRTSLSGMGVPSGGAPGGGAGSSATGGAGQSAMMQGGGAYGNRQYGGGSSVPSRHGGGGGYNRGSRYDGGSADSSRPSSRGPHPHGGGGGGHTRHPHPADPVPPPEASPWPDPKGLCDLDRFISQIEPVIAIDPVKPPQQALQELKLRDLWNFYFEPSLYGREVFTLGGHRGASNSYFVPYLSAIQIFTRALPTDVGGTNRLYVSEDNQGWPKHMHLKFEYFEQELPFNRLPLYDQIELLSSTMAAGKASGSGSGAAGNTSGMSGTRPVPAAQGATSQTTPTASTGVGIVASASVSSSIGKESPATTDSQGAADKAVSQAVVSGGSSEAEPAEGVNTAGRSGAEAAGAAANAEKVSARPAAVTGCAGPAECIPEVAGPSVPTAGDASAATGTSAAPAAQAGPARPTGATVATAPAPEADASSTGAGTGLLYDMRLLDVHPASWFAVAWYPVYRIPDAPLYARFLTFHSFAPLVESMRNVHERLAMGQVAPYYLLSLPVVGLNWYNMQGERWMEPLDESMVARAHNGSAPPPPVAASAPAASVNSPRGPPHHQRGGGGGTRVPGTDVWYQHWLQNYQITADRLARGVGLKVLGQHGAEEVRLRVPDYEFFRARA